MDLHDSSDCPEPRLPLFARDLPSVQLHRNPAADTGRADDIRMLSALLSASSDSTAAAPLANALLQKFRTAPRVLAAPPDRLRRVAGIAESHVTLIKTAEALAKRHARAALPDTVNPVLDAYTKVIDYCRTLTAHRDVEELHLLHLDTKNRLIANERHQRGTIAHTPAYPREICLRVLDVGSSALVIVHNHPSGVSDPSQADIDLTNRVRDALKLIGTALHDHLILTPSEAFSFRDKGLL